MATSTRTRTASERYGFVDSVLDDLISDSWFQAQHDVVTVTGQAPVTVTTPSDPFAEHDRWNGDDSEIHAFLALHPAF